MPQFYIPLNIVY